MIKLTDIVYYGNGFVATFDDNSVANTQFKVVDGKLIIIGLNPEQKEAVDVFNDTSTDTSTDIRFQGPAAIRSMIAKTARPEPEPEPRFDPIGNTYSFDFDGVDQFCWATLVAFDPSLPYSISLWYKFNSDPNDGVNQFWYSPFADGTGSGWGNHRAAIYIRMHPTYYGQMIAMREGVGGASGTNTDVYSASWFPGHGSYIDPGYGDWHHVVMTSTSTTSAGFINLWLDGIHRIVDKVGQGYGGSNSNTIPTIGMRANGISGPNPPTVSSPFPGKIDEVVIWQRALDSSDIEALYNEGVPSDPRDIDDGGGPIHWWRMGDGGGDSAVDGGTVYDQIGTLDMTSINTEEADKVEDVPS